MQGYCSHYYLNPDTFRDVYVFFCVKYLTVMIIQV